MIVHYLEGTFLRNGDLRPPPQARDPCKERRRDHIGGRGFGGNGGQGGQGDASGLSPAGVAKGLACWEEATTATMALMGSPEHGDDDK